MEEVEVLLPYQQGDLLEQVHSSGEVIEASFIEEGVRVRARVPPLVLGRIKKYRVDKVEGEEAEQLQQVDDEEEEQEEEELGTEEDEEEQLLRAESLKA